VRPRPSLGFVLDLLAPPLCAVCVAPSEAEELLCRACRRELAGARSGAAPVAGVGAVSWAARYEGVARGLVAALKFRGSLGLAGTAGAAVARLAAARDGWAVVAVPAAPLRRRRRGYDPAELIAAAAAAELGLPLAAVLRRAGGPRQVGRRRADRLATPPRVWACAAVPDRALLVDDVLTTGATLAACAGALRAAGTAEVEAAVFARALGDRSAGA
jgi:predicted amidophosphoribosyltransferase